VNRGTCDTVHQTRLTLSVDEVAGDAEMTQQCGPRAFPLRDIYVSTILDESARGRHRGQAEKDDHKNGSIEEAVHNGRQGEVLARGDVGDAEHPP
jgi:hypothetical protein